MLLERVALVPVSEGSAVEDPPTARGVVPDRRGHEVLVIEKDSRRCLLIEEELGNVVQQGDAAEASVLADAGTERADVIVAVTGDDEDNLVICQVAKSRFKTPRAVARINNPKNEQIFRMLGIDSTVSSTDVILGVLEQELPAHSMVMRKVRARMPRSSSSDKARGRSTRPPTCRRQAPASTCGMSKWMSE